MRAQYQKFGDEYLKDFNQTQAAIRAGYKERSAYNQGSRLMKIDEVAAYIQARIKELTLGPDEVLIRLGQQARGAQAQYISHVRRADPETGAEWTEPVFDFEQCEEDGNLHLIKGWGYDKAGRLQVDFYDAQSALVHIGRHHKLFNTIDVTSGGEKIQNDDELRQKILSQLSRIADASETSRASGEPDA